MSRIAACAAGFTPGGLLGCTTLEVNSFHHQAVDRLGSGLQAVAWSPDGVVEGLESTDHPWLVCVQYHPEDLIEAHAPSQRLLEGFVAACRERSARHPPLLALLTRG